MGGSGVRDSVLVRRRLRTTLLVIFVGLFVLLAVRSRWGEMQDDLARLSRVDVATSFVAALAALLCGFATWRVLLSDLGGRLEARDAFRLFFFAQLGKYVPGSVWPAVLQADMGRRRNIPHTTMFGAFTLHVLVTVAVGGVLAPLALLVDRSIVVVVGSIACAGGGALTFAVLLDGHLIDRVVPLVGRLIRRDLAPRRPSSRAMVVASFFALAAWTVFGLHVWFLTRSFGAHLDLVPAAIGMYAMAFIAGLLVVPLPAGAGLREFLLIVTLSGQIGRASAVVVGLAARFVSIVAELTLAAVAVPRRHVRSDSEEGT